MPLINWNFNPFGWRQVTGRFDGGGLTSDGGGLLREVEQRLDLFSSLAGCFMDYRRAGMVEHPVQALLAQRIHGLALGYEEQQLGQFADRISTATLRANQLRIIIVEKGRQYKAT